MQQIKRIRLRICIVLDNSMAAKIAWAIDQTGFARYVREVPNGKACGCICMDCGEKLIAYHPNPLEKTAYFGHYSTGECSGESVLHKVAKKILEELAQKQSSISLPPYHATAIGKDILGLQVYSSYQVPIPKFDMQYAFSEKRMKSVILDSLVANPEGENIGIEIYVRNKKSRADKIKFDELPIEVMEIDLSNIPWSVDREDLEKQLLNVANRRWLNHLSHKNAKIIAESKLPDIINLHNLEITSHFNDLRTQTIAKSYQAAIPIKVLKSKPITVGDNPSFRVEKHISIRNLRQVQSDLFNSCDSFEADLLADGKQKNNFLIQLYFVRDGKMPKNKSAHVVFRLIYDEVEKSFSFKVLLRGDSDWVKALNKIAELQQAVRERSTVHQVIEI